MLRGAWGVGWGMGVEGRGVGKKGGGGGRGNKEIKARFEKFVGYWVSSSRHPRRVTSGRITHSKFVYTSSKRGRRWQLVERPTEKIQAQY